MYMFILRVLNEVLGRLKQVSSQSPQRIETSDNSEDETDTNKRCRKILSKRTIHMEKVYGASELSKFFLTKPTNAPDMFGHFCCRVCRKGLSVLTNGNHEALRHFQGNRHFARGQRLRLETPGWCVLEFHGNPMSKDELERQTGKIKKVPLWFATSSVHLQKI